MTDIFNLISDKIDAHKSTQISFNELFDNKVSYKVYLQYKEIFNGLVKEYYENIDLQECDKTTIEFDELKVLFCSKYYTNSLDWKDLSKTHKIKFIDYVNCYELLKKYEYIEFKNYLNQFNITDVDEIITELKTL